MGKLTEMAREAQTIAVLGHVHPDGDCIGSCLAVQNYLSERFPEKPIQVYLEKPADKFRYMKHFDEVSQDPASGARYDLCICLDCGDRGRLGEFAVYLDGAGHSICIDHHVTNQGYAEENIICAGASSTCEVVFGLMDEEKVSRETAECLYTGIIHDTNVFKNSNTSFRTMEAAGKLMAKGIDFGGIIDGTFYRKTYIQNQILGRAMLESITFLDGKCIFAAVRRKDMVFYGAASSDLEGIVEQLRVTDGVECAIFLHELESHLFKVSMRSNRYVDVSKVAAFFGGGGHVRAAGCTMGGTVHDVINNLSVHIAEQM
ncbi:MAG: bifunctional oligoribonuclease/PAP phosphatase NrnA [Lachnospiraceae bacterium]|nr:bifunctional oligoribonuclease/PAP phosphatase NrnA [Lachnospiraceae bacterium]